MKITSSIGNIYEMNTDSEMKLRLWLAAHAMWTNEDDRSFCAYARIGDHGYNYNFTRSFKDKEVYLKPSETISKIIDVFEKLTIFSLFSEIDIRLNDDERAFFCSVTKVVNKETNAVVKNTDEIVVTKKPKLDASNETKEYIDKWINHVRRENEGLRDPILTVAYLIGKARDHAPLGRQWRPMFGYGIHSSNLDANSIIESINDYNELPESDKLDLRIFNSRSSSSYLDFILYRHVYVIKPTKQAENQVIRVQAMPTPKPLPEYVMEQGSKERMFAWIESVRQQKNQNDMFTIHTAIDCDNSYDFNRNTTPNSNIESVLSYIFKDKRVPIVRFKLSHCYLTPFYGIIFDKKMFDSASSLPTTTSEVMAKPNLQDEIKSAPEPITPTKPADLKPIDVGDKVVHLLSGIAGMAVKYLPDHETLVETRPGYSTRISIPSWAVETPSGIRTFPDASLEFDTDDNAISASQYKWSIIGIVLGVMFMTILWLVCSGKAFHA